MINKGVVYSLCSTSACYRKLLGWGGGGKHYHTTELFTCQYRNKEVWDDTHLRNENFCFFTDSRVYHFSLIMHKLYVSFKPSDHICSHYSVQYCWLWKVGLRRKNCFYKTFLKPSRYIVHVSIQTAVVGGKLHHTTCSVWSYNNKACDRWNNDD